MKDLTTAANFVTARCVEDGDDVDEAAFTEAFQSLADRDHWLHARVNNDANFPNGIAVSGGINASGDIEGLSNLQVQGEGYAQVGLWTDGFGWFGDELEVIGEIIATGSLRLPTAYQVSCALNALISTNFAFDVTSGTGSATWNQHTVSSAGVLWIPIQPPSNHATIVRALCTLRGDIAGGSAHSALPATRPTLAIIRQERATAAFTVVGSVTDTSANAAAYNASHTLTTPAVNHALDVQSAYYLRITGEAGANSVAGALGVIEARVEWDEVRLGAA